MQDINKYVSGLLFIHDCVILPGFGGFVSNERSAIHNEVNHTFHPPKKDVLFNKNLTYNDGLLINYLAKNLNISYTEAKKRIQEEVQKAWLKLDKNEEVVFNGVGSFKYDKNQNLIFTAEETENFLIDSYGLSSFRFPPLSYQKNAREIIPLYNHTHMNEGVKKTLKWASILILPIIGALALVPYSKSKLNQQSAGLNPDMNIEKSIESTHSAMPNDSITDEVLDQSTDKKVALFYTEGTQPSVKKQQTQGFKFYIIGGSYRDENNAKEQVKIYRDKGFDKTQVMFVDELYRVYLQDFDSKVNAIHELRRIRNEEKNDQVWLYSKKNKVNK
ncbi:MAG: SPOR domain-containing protein [Salinivirgaceae bacterium]|nr:SPOR domain-containing protein [Salinivirgaceae bacterium]